MATAEFGLLLPASERSFPEPPYLGIRGGRFGIWEPDNANCQNGVNREKREIGKGSWKCFCNQLQDGGRCQTSLSMALHGLTLLFGIFARTCFKSGTC